MRNLNSRSYALVVLFALGLFAFGAVGLANNWGIFKQPTREKILNLEARNLAAFEQGALDVASVDLYFNVKPPSNSEETRQVDIEMTDTIIWLRDDDDTMNVKEVCLVTIDALVAARTDVDFYHNFLAEPTCFTPSESDYSEGEIPFVSDIVIDRSYVIDALDKELTRSLSLTQPNHISLNFWYPYDQFELNMDVMVGYDILLDDDTVIEGTIQPFINWDLQTTGNRLWDIRITSQSAEVDVDDSTPEMNAGMVEQITFNFDRPLVYRIIFPFFVVMMILLIALVPLLGDRDTLVDICAAMLFGIFGLKGIIGPGEAMGQTVLDLTLIGLYVILAFAGFLFFLNKVSVRRREQSEDAEQQRVEEARPM